MHLRRAVRLWGRTVVARSRMSTFKTAEPSRLRYNTPLRDGARAVLCYGDSLTAGYCDGGYAFSPYAPTLEASLENVRVDYCGHSGMTAGEMVSLADARDVGLRAILDSARSAGAPYERVVLLAGTNDLATVPGSADPTAAAEAVAGAIRSLHEIAIGRGAGTLAVGIPGSRAQLRVPFYGALADGANAALARTSPAYAAFPVPFAEGDRHWDPDGLHMTRAGYAALGAGLAPSLAALPPP